MLHSKDDNQDHIDLLNFPQDAEVGKVAVPIIPDSQAEFLQGKTLDSWFLLLMPQAKIRNKTS